MDVTFREPELDLLLNEPQAGKGTVGAYMRRLSREMKTFSQKKVGVRTGRLRASIHENHYRWTRGQAFTLGSDLHYALLHHTGARPHVIRSRHGRMLKFVVNGRVVYARQVLHPGIRPNHYLSDALILVKK